jgi:hypothetical protein
MSAVGQIPSALGAVELAELDTAWKAWKGVITPAGVIWKINAQSIVASVGQASKNFSEGA